MRAQIYHSHIIHHKNEFGNPRQIMHIYYCISSDYAKKKKLRIKIRYAQEVKYGQSYTWGFMHKIMMFRS